MYDSSIILRIVKKPCFKKLKPSKQKDAVKRLKKFFEEYMQFRPRNSFFKKSDKEIKFNVDFIYLEMALKKAKLDREGNIIFVAENIKEGKTYYLKLE